MQDVYIVEMRFVNGPAEGWFPWFERGSLVEACREILRQRNQAKTQADPREYRILLLQQLDQGMLYSETP